MSKVKKQASRSKTEISKEIISILEETNLPEDILKKIFDLLEIEQSPKREEEGSRSLILPLQAEPSPQEILVSVFDRLDNLIQRNRDMKSRVNTLNNRLKEIAYFN
jgi:hypothetical protein